MAVSAKRVPEINELKFDQPLKAPWPVVWPQLCKVSPMPPTHLSTEYVEKSFVEDETVSLIKLNVSGKWVRLVGLLSGCVMLPAVESSASHFEKRKRCW